MTKIKTEIDSLADVAKATNCDLEAVANMMRALPIPEDEQQYLIDVFNWTKIAQAFNERKILTFIDGKQKYFPYAWVKADESDPSGFALARTRTDWTYACTDVGARHLFLDEKRAAAAIAKFPEVFKGAFVRNGGMKA